jgi:hypothetical protein
MAEKGRSECGIDDSLEVLRLAAQLQYTATLLLFALGCVGSIVTAFVSSCGRLCSGGKSLGAHITNTLRLCMSA